MELPPFVIGVPCSLIVVAHKIVSIHLFLFTPPWILTLWLTRIPLPFGKVGISLYSSF